MKVEEQIASRFLSNFFEREPQYEPLGEDSPPDFSIGGAAFEVRRLNQRYFGDDGSKEGLEQVDYRLNRAVRDELTKIPFSQHGGSFYWGLRFQRPLSNDPGRIARKLARFAHEHYREKPGEAAEIIVDDVVLDLILVGTANGRAFAPGYVSDYDSGGWLGEIYPVSIRLALEEKIAKTSEVAPIFDRWGLILVDCILPGMMAPNDIGPLELDLRHFNSLVIIDPDGKLTLEWPEGSLKGCQLR